MLSRCGLSFKCYPFTEQLLQYLELSDIYIYSLKCNNFLESKLPNVLNSKITGNASLLKRIPCYLYLLIFHPSLFATAYRTWGLGDLEPIPGKFRTRWGTSWMGCQHTAWYSCTQSLTLNHTLQTIQICQSHTFEQTEETLEALREHATSLHIGQQTPTHPNVLTTQFSQYSYFKSCMNRIQITSQVLSEDPQTLVKEHFQDFGYKYHKYNFLHSDILVPIKINQDVSHVIQFLFEPVTIK